MYATEMPALRDHGRASPEGFADLCTFVLLSIRQPFVKIGEQVKDVRAKGDASRFLWGWKVEGYHAARGEIGRDTWRALQDARYAQDAICEIMAIPGLGIVKAAFVAQMLGYDCACLDSRNLERMGLSREAWHVRNKKARDIAARVDDYVTYCQEQGEPATFWDVWCEDVSRDTGGFYSPEDVSKMHLAAIG